MSYILTPRLKKTIEKSEKQKNEQPWTLAYTLVLQTMSSPLSFFCGSRPIWFSLQNYAM